MVAIVLALLGVPVWLVVGSCWAASTPGPVSQEPGCFAARSGCSQVPRAPAVSNQGTRVRWGRASAYGRGSMTYCS